MLGDQGEGLMDFMKEQLSRFEDDAALGKNGGLFIAFRTPMCAMPDRLRDEYPEHMAIILEKCFEGLYIGEDRMAVTLKFQGAKARLAIPYDRIFQMYDPATLGPYCRRVARERGVVVSLADFRRRRDGG